jgi:hypothetical protein
MVLAVPPVLAGTPPVEADLAPPPSLRSVDCDEKRSPPQLPVATNIIENEASLKVRTAILREYRKFYLP